MKLNEYGQSVEAEWLKTGEKRRYVILDEYVVMPNHFHAVLVITSRGTARRAPTFERFGKPVGGSLPTIIRSFKSAVTKRINQIRNIPGGTIWQRNYFERGIRNEKEVQQIRKYIAENPLKWIKDEYHPEQMKEKQ